MPNGGISIYFAIKDGASSVLSHIGDQTKSLDKETQGLAQTTKMLQESNKDLLVSQSNLKGELSDTDKKVKEARKAYKEYGDELSKSILDQAIEDQARLRTELESVNDQIKGNNKTYREYLETLRKGGQSSDGAAGNGITKGNLWGLAAGQAGELVSGSLGSFADARLTSMIGTPDAALVSDTVSGMVSGLLYGAVGGPIGMAIGAAAGAFSGFLNGDTEIFQAKDDAFKEYYNSLYEAINANTDALIETGSTIAAQRETDMISFTTLFGSEGVASKFLDDLVDMANTTPFRYSDLTAMSKTLATYGYGVDELLPTLQKVGDAGAALGMGVSDMNAVATALGRMESSDKATLEYLNILNDRGIGAIGYLAEAKGQSVGDTYAQISKGEIRGTDAVEIILNALERDFAGSMLEQSQTFSGLTSTLEGLKQEISNAGGEGYNTLREEGLREEIDAYGGALGEALQGIAEISGQNRAYLENLSDQYQREALGAVLMGEETSGIYSDEDRAALAGMREEYVKASEEYANGSQEAGLKMESLKEQAEALATAAYESSEQYQALMDTQLDQVAAIRENTEGLAAATNAYRMAAEQSKGLAASLSSGIGAAGVSKTAMDAYGRGGGFSYGGYYNKLPSTKGHAAGLEKVPYDDYPALLHQDERVLTANEARQQDRDEGADVPSGVQIVITGNSFTGTGEEMVDQIAQLLAQRLEQAARAAAPR